jgi:hypothetical protein
LDRESPQNRSVAHEKETTVAHGHALQTPTRNGVLTAALGIAAALGAGLPTSPLGPALGAGLPTSPFGRPQVSFAAGDLRSFRVRGRETLAQRRVFALGAGLLMLGAGLLTSPLGRPQVSFAAGDLRSFRVRGRETRAQRRRETRAQRQTRAQRRIAFGRRDQADVQQRGKRPLAELRALEPSEARDVDLPAPRAKASRSSGSGMPLRAASTRILAQQRENSDALTPSAIAALPCPSSTRIASWFSSG